MADSSCTVSFFRNDLQKSKLPNQCPVRNCSININDHKVPFQNREEKMQYLPFCPEHGIRIHKDGFVYYNGLDKEDLALAIKRNLMFNSDYYITHFLESNNKIESKRLCYESSEDAVSYNVFTELLSEPIAIKKLVHHIVEDVCDDVELYLWGRKIDLENNVFEPPYQPLQEIREMLEPGRKSLPKPPTEPDIMLIVPKKFIILIEAKFGSKNPIAEDEKKENRRRRTAKELIEDYCDKNTAIGKNEIFDFSKPSPVFYEQIFRNIVFSASMAKQSGIEKWYVVNLRNQHVMNMKRGKPESKPIMRNIHSMLQPKYRKEKRFIHLTWEQIYDIAIKDNDNLCDLKWYLKNKSLHCGLLI